MGVNILYTVNDAFAAQLAVGALSICENNKKADEINFFVFSDGVSGANQQAIEDLVAPYGRRISFIDIHGFMTRIGESFDTAGWNEIVMSRLLIASFLPNTIDRLIYLDGDTVVRHSLEAFWATDLGDAVIGAAPEPTADARRRESLGIGGRQYFNAGVLLIDLQKWKDRNVEERILDYCKRNSDSLFANDQDALNVVLKDEVFYVPPAYNSCNSYWFYSYDFLNGLMSDFCSEEEYSRAKNDPIIVHYLGEERPWRKGNHHRFADDYYLYLEKTPWADTPMEAGWSMYFTVWTLFNAVFCNFPKARYGIINGLIPAFMKFRKKRRAKG